MNARFALNLDFNIEFDYLFPYGCQKTELLVGTIGKQLKGLTRRLEVSSEGLFNEDKVQSYLDRWIWTQDF